MKPVTLYLTAALAAGLGTTPAIAQGAGDAFANAPLTLEQDQVISRARETNRKVF